MTEGMGGFGDLLKKAMEAKSEIERIQRETARQTAEGDAGGGSVRVVANGVGEVLSITIEESLLKAGDAEMIQDLTAAAVNVALRNAKQLMAEAMSAATSGLGLGIDPNSGNE